MVDRIDTLVVGAGVIGLAVARKFALSAREVLIVDRADAIGTGTSSRNSEVIHAGIYYEPGSLRARLCVEGRQQLYTYCAERGVEARRIGKLIVAQTEAEIPKLERLLVIAKKNEVDDLSWLSAEDAARIEPELTCVRALLSPSTGIIDGHGLMLAIEADAEAHGAVLALRTTLISGTVAEGGLFVKLADESGNPFELECGSVINCAGHGAHALARSIAGLDPLLLPPRFLAKGSYCSVSGKSPFSHLIYPVPVPGALGTHVTVDMQGRARLGPNIEWVEEEDYSVSDRIVPEFVAAVEGYWPGIRDREVTASYCGIRPKVHGPNQNAADFVIQGPKTHGVTGLVNLFGIESPGLTSSLAIADFVWSLLN